MNTASQFFKDSPQGILIVLIFAIVGYLSCDIWLFSNIKYQENEYLVTMLENENNKSKNEVNADSIDLLNKDIKVVKIDNNDLFFNRNPNFLVWMILILTMVTIAFAAFPVFSWQIIRIKEDFKLDKWHMFQSLLFAFLVIMFIVFFQKSTKGFYVPSKIIDNFGILLKHGYVVPSIVIVTFILQLPILILIFLVDISAKKIKFDIRNKQSIEKAFFRFSGLNQMLNSSLQILAIMIVFSVLTTSAIEHSIKSTLILTSIDIFPKEMSYVYRLTI